VAEALFGSAVLPLPLIEPDVQVSRIGSPVNISSWAKKPQLLEIPIVSHVLGPLVFALAASVQVRDHPRPGIMPEIPECFPRIAEVEVSAPPSPGKGIAVRAFWTACGESDRFGFMGLGTKNRQQQTAELCKEHLRGRYLDQRVLVEDFIREIEGEGKANDPTQWGQFTDLSRDTGKMIERLDERFNKWLTGDV